MRNFTFSKSLVSIPPSVSCYSATYWSYMLIIQEDSVFSGLTAVYTTHHGIVDGSRVDSFRPVNSRWVYFSLLSAGTIH